MKKVLIFALVAIAMFLMFSSCKSNEEPVVNPLKNDAALKAKLALIPNPSKEEMLKFLSGTAQKVKADDSQPSTPLTLVEIFPLDSTIYQIYDNTATKYFIYYEIDSQGNRKKVLTIGQIFDVVNNQIDEKGYHFEVTVGCPFGRYFYIANGGNLQQIIYFLRFNNGSQFAFYSNSGNYQIKLPPVVGAKWQMKISYYDGDLFQSFMTEIIDYYGESDVIKINFEIKQENVLSMVYINKSYLQNAYVIDFIGTDDNGNFTDISLPVAYDQSLPEIISFNTPIKVLTRITIFSTNYGYICYSLKVRPDSPIDGSKILYDFVPIQIPGISYGVIKH